MMCNRIYGILKLSEYLKLFDENVLVKMRQYQVEKMTIRKEKIFTKRMDIVYGMRDSRFEDRYKKQYRFSHCNA